MKMFNSHEVHSYIKSFLKKPILVCRKNFEFVTGKIESIVGVDNYKTTSLMNYIMSEDNFDFEERNEDSKIAVIYAQGEIVYGEGNEDKIGQRMMVKAIERAIRNKKVKVLENWKIR